MAHLRCCSKLVDAQARLHPMPPALAHTLRPFALTSPSPHPHHLPTPTLFLGYQHFDMIHLGGYISALSPFWMVAFQAEWASALFVAMLSLGEAIWSPRW